MKAISNRKLSLSPWLAVAILLVLMTLLLIVSAGCTQLDHAALDADLQRRQAVQGPIEFYIEHHPQQAQTWTDFLRAWDLSIEARRGVIEQ